MARDPRIDAYIAKAADFARPVLVHIRETVHAAQPGLDEAIKWGMPHFIYKGKNLAGMAAFKAHCAMVIHGDGRQGDAMGQYGKIASTDDLPGVAEIKAKLLAARDRIDAEGSALKKKSAPRQPKPEIAMPPELAAALAANAAAKATYDGFSPSARREYLEWITEAKTEATRAKRIAQAIEWIAEGKKRNWKYERC